jgi:hypothetical protein
MPVPSSITDLSTTAGSNSPAGSETPTEGDNYIRTYGAFIALLRDKLNGTSDTGTVKNATFSGTMAGAAAWSALQTFAAGLTASAAITGTTATFSGAVTASNLLSGTYTPTLTNVGNATLVSGVCQYLRVGSVVTVSGQIQIDPGIAAQTQVGISLPVASNLASSGQLAGIGADVTNAGTSPAQYAAIYGDATNNRAELQFPAGLTSNAAWSIHFTYLIV